MHGKQVQTGGAVDNKLQCPEQLVIGDSVDLFTEGMKEKLQLTSLEPQVKFEGSLNCYRFDPDTIYIKKRTNNPEDTNIWVQLGMDIKTEQYVDPWGSPYIDIEIGSPQGHTQLNFRPTNRANPNPPKYTMSFQKFHSTYMCSYVGKTGVASERVPWDTFRTHISQHPFRWIQFSLHDGPKTLTYGDLIAWADLIPIGD
jgi:hypothetical protein